MNINTFQKKYGLIFNSFGCNCLSIFMTLVLNYLKFYSEIYTYFVTYIFKKKGNENMCRFLYIGDVFRVRDCREVARRRGEQYPQDKATKYDLDYHKKSYSNLVSPQSNSFI